MQTWSLSPISLERSGTHLRKFFAQQQLPLRQQEEHEVCGIHTEDVIDLSEQVDPVLPKCDSKGHVCRFKNSYVF